MFARRLMTTKFYLDVSGAKGLVLVLSVLELLQLRLPEVDSVIGGNLVFAWRYSGPGQGWQPYPMDLMEGLNEPTSWRLEKGEMVPNRYESGVVGAILRHGQFGATERAVCKRALVERGLKDSKGKPVGRSSFSELLTSSLALVQDLNALAPSSTVGWSLFVVYVPNDCELYITEEGQCCYVSNM